jgi:predicted HAD superfamily Cof-like phosphohydrolase
MNTFRDQEKFMRACEQTVGEYNEQQYQLYLNLITEEKAELDQAVAGNDRVEQLDALIDIMVVTIGALHSMGADGEGAWKEVMSSNFSKIDRHLGKVRRRDDGKILKPIGWEPPKLAQFVNIQ